MSDGNQPSRPDRFGDGPSSGSAAGVPPTVSVLIPTHNRRAMLAECIGSVFAQAYSDFELVVVADGCTDDTCDYLATITDPRFRYWCNDDDLGAARTHNRCLSHARGRYVKIVNDDDLLYPEILERQVAVLEDPGYADVVMASCRRRVIDPDGREIMTNGWRHEGVVKGCDAIRMLVRSGKNEIGEPPAVLFRAEALEYAGGFREDADWVLDIDLWTRMLTRGDLYMFAEPLMFYRLNANSLSVGLAHKQRDEFAKFARRLAADPEFGLTEDDVRAATRAAARQERLRGLFYALFLRLGGHMDKLLYLVVGGWNTLFGYAAFAAFYRLLGGAAGTTLPLVLAYTVSTINAYLGYKFIVFRTKGNYLVEFVRFSAVYVLTLLANVFALPAAIRLLGMNPYVAQAAFTVVIVVASYLAHRYFSFRTPVEFLAEESHGS